MDLLPYVVVALVAAGLGGALGWNLGRRREPTAQTPVVRTPATLEVIDTLVADSIRRLRGWISPSDGDPPLTLAPDGTITLLFSDIADSTSLNHRVGDAAFAEVLRAHDKIVARVVTGHGGRVVKTQGDGFMAAFHDPVAGAGCALDLRDTLADDADVGHRLDLRIGLHTGSAVTTDADVFGESVAFAARVASDASGGEVVASDAVRDRVEAVTDEIAFSSRLFRRSLKGIPGRHRLSLVSRAP